MADTPSQWCSNVHILLLHHSQPFVLLLPGEPGWSLLHLQRTGRMWLPYVAPLQHLLAQHLGLHATVLRCVQAQEAQQQLDAIFLMENHSPGWSPPGDWQWVGRETLAHLPLAVPEQRASIDSCLAEIAGEPEPTRRAPWARQGWLTQVQAWITAQLDRLDCIFVPPVEQVRSWGISSVLRVRTFTGDLYFKASGTQPLFAREAPLVHALAARYPEHIPTPLAIDPDRNWMLLADCGPSLRDVPDATVWTEALLTFARLQQATAAHVQDWLTLGCQDRRLNLLATHLDALLHDDDVATQVPAEDMAQLHHLAPQIRAMCRALAEYRIPVTLVHGDLHAGNMARNRDTYCFFDWTDGCIAHPWFDLLPMWREATRHPQTVQAWPQMLDAYLALWTGYAPLERLRQAWALAQPLGALHHAVSYQYLLAGLDVGARRDLTWGLPFWVRQIVQTIPSVL